MIDWLSSAEIAQKRPTVSFSQAEALLRDRYGIRGQAETLPSDRDVNFRIQADEGQRFVLKITSAVTPVERLAFELHLLELLGAELDEVGVPVVQPTLDGQPVIEISEGHHAYVVTWLDGFAMGEVRPHTVELLKQIGRMTARIDRALSSVGEAQPLIASPWDTRKAPTVVASLINSVDTSERRELIQHFTAYCESVVAPVIETLPQQVIHNDLNDYNLLTSCDFDGVRLTGVLDVGDAAWTIRVADPVIAATYAAMHWEDPVGAIATLLGAYHEENPLTPEELLICLPLVAMRLCVSVCVSAYRAREEPDDAYLIISQEGAWKTLETLSKQSLDLGHYRIRAACGLEPCTRSERVRNWIEAHRDAFSPMFRFDLASDPRLVLDLSVGSPEPYVLADESTATREIQTAMDRAGVDVAIGRYDEVRLAYDAPLFEIETLDGRVQRTVHLGVDVFRPVGEEVLAPLDGTVHGLSDELATLGYGPTVVLRHDVESNLSFFTLYGHLKREDVQALEVGRHIAAGSRIARIGNATENGGWTPHLHFQVIADMLGRRDTFPGVCTYQDRETWTSISPAPYAMLGLSTIAGDSDLTPEALAEDRSNLLSKSLSVSYDRPLTILRASGTYMFDHAGRRYLDCVNNVNHVGHAHPTVAKAVADQMRVLNTNTRYLHPTILEYARRLTEKLPDPLSVCFFVNSGSEANDLALRLAHAHTGRSGVIVLDAAYHGHLTSLVGISPYKFAGPGGEGRPEHVFVADLPDPFRGKHRGDDAATQYAASVRECIDQAFAQAGGAAAFICESLLSCGGQIVLPDGYLSDVYRLARQAGVVCIADEVQVGFGRVGSHFWGFETQGVVPDIVTMGKPIGNGHPLAAVVTTAEIAASFQTGMEYFNTFGGNPVSCAAGLAVLETVEQEALQAHALEVGGYLLDRLIELKDRFEFIGDVRGRGLFIGVEFVTDRESRTPAAAPAGYVVNRARQLGVLLSTDGPDHNVIKIKPPLTFSREDADALVATLGQILSETPLANSKQQTSNSRHQTADMGNGTRNSR